MATKTKSTANGAVKNRIAEHLDAPATMRPEIVTFKIIGISPLLQNNPTNFIGVSDDSALASKKKYDDAEEARLRVYQDGDGNYCHPSNAFTKAMLSAVSGKKFGKMFATKLIKGGVFITEPFAIIESLDGKPATKYRVQKDPVIIGKARVPRCRPCWDKWQMKVAFEVDMSILQASHVLESLSLAGRIIGVGDWRPEKTGGYGRFRAELVK